MKLAIIGAGISGLYAAHRLHAGYDMHVFEAGSWPGGHSHTIDIDLDGQRIPVDTGFIVFNERNYPLYSALLRKLGVASQAADMSFSFRCGHSNLEYRGDATFDAIFAQRRNMLRPSFYRMIADILRFNSAADQLVASPPGLSLGDWLGAQGFGGPVVHDYLLPMASAIWSAEPDHILEFPACHFGHFFRNHGLLQVGNRPQWMTVCGGSRQYVRALIEPFHHRVHLDTPVEWVERHPDRVRVKAAGSEAADFDQVIFACHSDQALRLLRDPTPAEVAILGAITYKDNDIVLHTDARLLPKRQRAWASWNYHRHVKGSRHGVSVTYNMTRLQSLPTDTQVLVTLNGHNAMSPDTILYQTRYAHPQFTIDSVAAQRRREEISGHHRSWYCGAYWGYGFHEDGVRSAETLCDILDARLGRTATSTKKGARDAQLHLSGTG
ncbi:MAG: FAD-dependent oxidoreductase [Gammaproteobacteria bacterium]